MTTAANWRIDSDYIGAGRFLVLPDRVIVGTNSGVQCLPHGDGPFEGWQVDLGARCIGVVQGNGDTLIAACVNGLFVLGPNGEERWGTHSEKEIVHHAVPFQDGVLMTSRNSIHYLHEQHGSTWRFDFREILGQSVRSIRLINLFDQDEHVVAGVVDYDSGLGRIVVLDKAGHIVWTNELGPLTELFPAGEAVFVWCQTGFGKFDTHMTRLDGHPIWEVEGAGVGAVRPDGALAMVVGSNESPEWDDWEYRQLSPTGKLERSVRAHGRCGVRPLCRDDGSVVFIGSYLPIDPASSRVDYTNFLAMPQEVHFQHLLGIRSQLKEHTIFVHCLRDGSDELELLYEGRNTYSLARPVEIGTGVAFCDANSIVAVNG